MKRKKWLLYLLSFVAALLIVASCLRLLFHCEPGQFAKCNYDQINNGMTLAEVELLLGTGTEVNRDALPRYPRPKARVVVPPDLPDRPPATAQNYPTEEVPVVEGEQFYRWERGSDYIIVAFKEGKVCDKTYWEPSW